jgi:heat shock protein HtpX
MDAHSRRRAVRSPVLTIEMVLLAVLVPSFALGALAAIVIFLPGHFLVLLAIGLGVGIVVRGYRHITRTRPEEQLSEHEDRELFAIVDRLCAMVDIPRPEIVLSDQRQANSWVVHRLHQPPRLYLTRALRDLLAPEELQAVLAHELTHIANRDALVMTVVGTPGAIMLNVRGGGLDGLLIAVIGLVSAIGTNALSRCRELAADAGSATITGRPSALASALLKVSESHAQIPRKDLREAAALNAFNLVPVTRRHRWWHDIRPLVPLTRTHPGLSRRIAALQALEQRQQQPRF